MQKDVYFIGMPQQMAEALLHALFIQFQYTEYMSQIIDALTGTCVNGRSHIVQVVEVAKFYPFWACDLPVPTDQSGVVYIIISK